MEPEVIPDYPVSPAGAPTALEEATTGTAGGTETCPCPYRGSYITSTTRTWTTGEEEHHTGVQGMRGEALEGGQVGPNHVPEAEMT